MRHRFAAASIFFALTVAGTSAFASTPNSIYVVPKRVDFFPNEGNATEVVVYGNFTLYQKSDAGSEYGEVTCGYMHFRCKSGEEATCRMQWSELKAAVAVPACKGIGQQSVVTPATLHPMGTPLGMADVYDNGMGLQEALSLGGKCPLLKTNLCNVTVASDAGVDAAGDTSVGDTSTADTNTGDTKTADTSTSAADAKSDSPADSSSPAADTGSMVTDTGKAGCTSNSDCPSGQGCVFGQCTFMEGPRCSDDKHQVIALNGAIATCSPYMCRDGACLTQCASNDDCNAGTACEQGACVNPKVAVEDDSGCSFGARTVSITGGTLAVALAAVARMMRRRRR